MSKGAVYIKVINLSKLLCMIITVMAATDADADEEMIAGIPGTSGGTKRRAGNMASMSGADNNLYTEFKKSKNLLRHPLFKKFGQLRK